MPTPRKTTAQLILNGSAKKHPDRIAARANEPRPDPNFGHAPRSLTPAQKKIWAEFVSEIPPLVVTKADRKIVHIAVLMWERVANATARASDFATLMKCLSQLGMTPADRSKIKVSKPEAEPEEDPFAEFVGPEPNDGAVQ
jgi:phage terminase small subunit